MLCEYECGQIALHRMKNGKWCCSSYFTKCPNVRNKNSKGLKRAYVKGNHKLSSEFSDETRQQMGKSNRGKTKFTCEHIRRKSLTTRKRYAEGKIKPSFKGKKHTAESKKKIRDYVINNVDGPFVPRRGLNESKLLDDQERINGCVIDRNFSVLNYFPDGYCHETNTVYEIYESWHFRNDETIQRDKIRQKEIQDKLNCQFIIIKDI